MVNHGLKDEYFDYLVDLVGGDHGYSMALRRLFSSIFEYSVENDDNRASDGVDLRFEFSCSDDDIDWLFASMPEECTVLEMMVALALRIENDIMYDPEIGDRSAEWFWLMFENMGLMEYPDERYDEADVDDIIDNLVQRRYRRNGVGGLFYIADPSVDMRKVEIWYQMNFYFCEHIEY